MNLLYECFKHFYHLDHSNAAIHMAPVRYSPITFRLAEAINNQHDVSQTVFPDVYVVMLDRNTYEEDRGR